MCLCCNYYVCLDTLIPDFFTITLTLTLTHSQQQANQRKGRAGRTCHGRCYRLYDERTYEELEDSSTPEIQRVALSQVVLQLLRLGISRPQDFTFLSPPSTGALRVALQELLMLGAVCSSPVLSNTGKTDGMEGKEGIQLTDKGRDMSRLPLEPRFSHLLLTAAQPVSDTTSISHNISTSSTSNTSNQKVRLSQVSYVYGCVEEMLTTVAMLSCISDGGGLFILPSNRSTNNNSSNRSDTNHMRLLASRKHKNLSILAGDLPTLLNIYQLWMHSHGQGGPKGRGSREWASSNFLSLKTLLRAHDIRMQLAKILGEILYPNTGSRGDSGNTGSLGRPSSDYAFPSCLPDKLPYLRCLAAGLCLNVAQRSNGPEGCDNVRGSVLLVGKGVKKSSSGISHESGKRGGGMGVNDGQAPYVTLRGREPVFLHPSSVLFSLGYGFKGPYNSNKSGGKRKEKDLLPQWVIYSDLLVTTKRYLRGVTAIEADWLVGSMFKKKEVALKSSDGGKTNTNNATNAMGNTSMRKQGPIITHKASNDNKAVLVSSVQTSKRTFSNYVPAGKQGKSKKKKI